MLAIHAFVVSKTTETKEISADGAVVVQDPGTQEQSVEAPAETAVTVITQPETLKWSFWALIGLAILIYVGKKWGELKPLDAIRVFIAPVAFVLWTMLTPDSAFDAAFPGAITEVNREVIAVFGAAVLGIVAKLLADKADQKPTPPPPPT